VVFKLTMECPPRATVVTSMQTLHEHQISLFG
jgi:hypothetical protein